MSAKGAGTKKISPSKHVRTINLKWTPAKATHLTIIPTVINPNPKQEVETLVSNLVKDVEKVNKDQTKKVRNIKINWPPAKVTHSSINPNVIDRNLNPKKIKVEKSVPKGEGARKKFYYNSRNIMSLNNLFMKKTKKKFQAKPN